MDPEDRSLIGFLLVAFALLVTAAVVDAQDGEQTVIEYRQAGAPYGPYFDAWHRATIPVGTDIQTDAVRVVFSTSYTWVRHVSGPQACVFTAVGGMGAPLTQIGGGRDCPRSQADPSGGYFMGGYWVWAVSGESCTSFGVPVCSGICW